MDERKDGGYPTAVTESSGNDECLWDVSGRTSRTLKELIYGWWVIMFEKARL